MKISGGVKQRVGIADLQEPVMAVRHALKNAALMITRNVDEAVLFTNRVVMLTNGRVATIGEALDVDLPRRRKHLGLARRPTYSAGRDKVLEVLYARHKAPALQAAE
jgi:nitrate/nitrite transport system ATP-binding protein